MTFVVLALANVVRIPIHLYTQKCEERFMSLANNIIDPKERGDGSPFFLFWTTCEGFDDDAKLKHYAPLLPRNVPMGESEVISKVKQFEGEDIFNYKSMSTIFVDN